MTDDNPVNVAEQTPPPQSADIDAQSRRAARVGGAKAVWQAVGGWLGALLGTIVGVVLAFAVVGDGLTVFGLVGFVVVGAIVGFSAGRVSGGYFSGDDASSPSADVCYKVWQVVARLRHDMLIGLDADDRRKMKRNRAIFVSYFLFASCYALVLIVLASGNGESLDAYLRFFAPLTDAVAGFLPRAVAVRGELLQNGYETEAGYAVHAIVMMRLFCIVALVAMLANLRIVYRSSKPSRLACPRHLFDLSHFGIYAGVLLFCCYLLLKETGFWTGVNFDSHAYRIGRLAQYHKTNIAALYEALVAGIYPVAIGQVQLAVMIHRAKPVYTE